MSGYNAPSENAAEFESTRDIPAIVRYHRHAVDEIVHSVEEGIYCALLGPRLCGKTLLLHYLEQHIAPILGWTCAYINLQEVRVSSQQVFFADLIRLTARHLTEKTGLSLPTPGEEEASSAVFRGFLAEYLELLERDLVLIIDPLEALPIDLVQALLTSLRAAYMDQQTLEHHSSVLVSGALSLATLAVGESSPFRGIARRVFVGDLSEVDSLALIEEFLTEDRIYATRPAREHLQQAASGDLYLIRRLTQRCAEIATLRNSRTLRSRDTTAIIHKFLRYDVLQYAPLLEAIRLIEEDPDLLQCILMLLERDAVPRSELPLPLSPDLDPLYLTGIVETVDEDSYRLQNLIYRQFLLDHFTPGRVGHVLTMVGRWDSAIGYLESTIQQGDRQSRADILPATINSIYASQYLAEAVSFLQRGLSAAFGIQEAKIWYALPQENMLRLIGQPGLDEVGEFWNDLDIPTTADRIEARAYRQEIPLRGQEGERSMLRAIPLKIPGRKPVGVVTLSDEPQSEILFTEQRERELQLIGFLNQAARALLAVTVRRQELVLAGRVQASLLPYAPPDLPGWQVAATWRPARETAGDYYDFISLPDGRLGIVIADVVDKGMGAALMMALIRTLIRTYATDYPDQPQRVLQMANQRLMTDVDVGMFVTLFYGTLDPVSGRLSYCNAGHPPPYLISPAPDSVDTSLIATGIPLGISEESHWEPGEVSIEPGELLFLYTDGVTDAMDQHGEQLGIERVLEAIHQAHGRAAEQIQDNLLARVYAHALGQPQVDDITLVFLAQELERPEKKKAKEKPLEVSQFRAGRTRIL